MVVVGKSHSYHGVDVRCSLVVVLCCVDFLMLAMRCNGGFLCCSAFGFKNVILV